MVLRPYREDLIALNYLPTLYNCLGVIVPILGNYLVTYSLISPLSGLLQGRGQLKGRSR